MKLPALSKLKYSCPSCGSDNTDLLDYASPGDLRKCRDCGEIFDPED